MALQTSGGRRSWIGLALCLSLTFGVVTSSGASSASFLTTQATGVTATTATVTGTLGAGTVDVAYSFMFGPTPSLGGQSAPATLPANSGVVTVSAALTRLTPNTTYYFELYSGGQNGGLQQFTTTNGPTINVTRLQGADRYATSAAIAAAKYPSGVPTGNVVVTTGADFADALSGAYLAGQLGAPIMLSPRTTVEPGFPTMRAALTSLHTRHVFILGGTAAVAPDVEGALAQAFTVTRIGGDTRYTTMQQVDTFPGLTPGVGPTQNRTAIVATGASFPDALAAGPLAWAKQLPVILTDGTQSALSPPATAVISALGIKNFLVMGGSSAIPSSQVAQLTSGGTVDQRFAGADRTETAALFATYAQAKYGFTKSTVILAGGQGYADALSAGPLGGDPVNIYLTEDADTLGSFTAAALHGLMGEVNGIEIVGGTAAVDANAAAAADSASQNPTNLQVPIPAAFPATRVTDTTETLTGTVNPHGNATTYFFEYGPTNAFGTTTPVQSAGTGDQPSAVQVDLTGLTQNTLYNFRLDASSTAGDIKGQPLTFTTMFTHQPVVTGVQPWGGSALGGGSVTVSGQNFGGATIVDFGGWHGTNINVNADGTSLTVVIPGHPAGRVDLRVTTPIATSAITSNGADWFVYVDPPTMQYARVWPGTYTSGPGSGTYGTISILFPEQLQSCAPAAYRYSNGNPTFTKAYVQGNSCVLAPAPGTTLAAATATDSLTYTGPPQPTIDTATSAQAGDGVVFAPSSDVVTSLTNGA